MEHINWTTFYRKIYIKTTAEEVYNSWSSQKGLESWFLKSAVFKDSKGRYRETNEPFQIGDEYEWRWHNWAGSSVGKIIEANGKDMIRFSFAESNVTIQLSTYQDNTLLSLTQDQIPTEESGKMNIYAGCNSGWTFWLVNLKAYLEHNILLNHTDESSIQEHRSHDFVNM